MTPLLLDLHRGRLGGELRAALGADTLACEQRRFPDGESYVRICGEAGQREVLVLADLSRPDPQFLSLVFVADTLRELGARRVGLVAPYLPYMRQDKRFHAGEALTSRSFAQLIGSRFDYLVTVDPHLHRYPSLDALYSIPATALHAAPLLAEWVAPAAKDAFLVGPDAESEQWVTGIAARSGLPFVVGSKQRRGDRSVSVTLPELGALTDKAAVIVDDVISSGRTLLSCIDALRASGVAAIDCMAVHGLFADDIDRQLRERGVRRVVTTDSVPHPSNAISLARLLADGVRKYWSGQVPCRNGPARDKTAG